MKRNISKYGAIVLGIGLMVGSVHALPNKTWDGEAADHVWTNAVNWNADTAPLSTDSLNIKTADPSNYAIYSAAEGTSTNRQLWVGFQADGRLDVTGGTLISDSYTFGIGLGGGHVGTMNVTGGVFRVTGSNGDAIMGADANDTGILNISSGAFEFNAEKLFIIGKHTSNGHGEVNMTGGSFSSANSITVANGGTSSGLFSVQGTNATISAEGWTQNAAGTLKPLIDAVDAYGVSTIEIVGAATFNSGSLLDIGFTNGAAIDGSWDVMHCTGSITDNGLAFAPGVDSAKWAKTLVDTDSSGTPDTLRVSYYSSGSPLFIGPTTPEAGAIAVSTLPTISVTVTNGVSTVDTAAFTMALIASGATNDVTSSVVIDTPSAGVTVFSYTPASPLDYETVYTVSYEVAPVGGSASLYSFSFTTTFDPAKYLIAPGIRNGGFELLSGVSNQTANSATDFSNVDDWTRLGTAGGAAHTEYNPSVATEGVRFYVGATDHQLYNMTTNIIQDGDVYEFKFDVAGRPYGEYAGLAYSDGTNIVVVSNSLAYTTGGTPPFEVGGGYAFDAGNDPDAIGKTLGLIFIDDGSGTSAVQIDNVRLFYGNIAIQSLTPAADETGVSDGTAIQVVIAEALSQVDVNSIVLTLDGVDVTTNSVINDTANGVTITYTPPSPLDAINHTATIAASGTPAGTISKSWSFKVFQPVFSGNAQYNINFQNNLAAVTNGTVIVAPSAGSNEWNNLVTPSGKTWVTSLPLDIMDANGENPIGLNWYGFNHDFGATVNNGIVDPLYQGFFGYQNFNGTLDITGLSTNAAYDIVVYFTWGYNENTVNYTITEGSGAVTNLALTPVRANCGSGAYSNIVEGVNYVIFSNLTASAAGRIDINAQSGDGGFSGLQIVQHGFGAPTFAPVIQSIGVSGSTVTLSWTADNVGTYSIERKTALTAGSWTPVATGLPAGNYSTNVTTSGASQEFYQIKGE